MILRIHKRGPEILVAACDEELLDATLKGGGLRMHISKGFYGEDRANEEELVIALKRCTTANLVGKKTVEAAIKAGLVESSGIIHVGDVPHAQIYRLIAQ